MEILFNKFDKQSEELRKLLYMKEEMKEEKKKKEEIKKEEIKKEERRKEEKLPKKIISGKYTVWFESPFPNLYEFPNNTENIVLNLKSIIDSEYIPSFINLKNDTNIYFIGKFKYKEAPFGDGNNSLGEYWNRSFVRVVKRILPRNKDFNIYTWLILDDFNLYSLTNILNLFRGDNLPIFLTQVDLKLNNFEKSDFKKIKMWTEKTEIINKITSTSAKSGDNIISRLILLEQKEHYDHIISEFVSEVGVNYRSLIKDRLKNLAMYKNTGFINIKETKPKYMEELLNFLRTYEKLRMSKNVLEIVEGGSVKSKDEKELLNIWKRLYGELQKEEKIEKEGKIKELEEVKIKKLEKEKIEQKKKRLEELKNIRYSNKENIIFEKPNIIIDKFNLTEEQIKELKNKFVGIKIKNFDVGIQNINNNVFYTFLKSIEEYGINEYNKLKNDWEKNNLGKEYDDTFEILYANIYLKMLSNKYQLKNKQINDYKFKINQIISQLGIESHDNIDKLLTDIYNTISKNEYNNNNNTYQIKQIANELGIKSKDDISFDIKNILLNILNVVKYQKHKIEELEHEIKKISNYLGIDLRKNIFNILDILLNKIKELYKQ